MINHVLNVYLKQVCSSLLNRLPMIKMSLKKCLQFKPDMEVAVGIFGRLFMPLMRIVGKCVKSSFSIFSRNENQCIFHI